MRKILILFLVMATIVNSRTVRSRSRLKKQKPTLRSSGLDCFRMGSNMKSCENLTLRKAIHSLKPCREKDLQSDSTTRVCKFKGGKWMEYRNGTPEKSSTDPPPTTSTRIANADVDNGTDVDYVVVYDYVDEDGTLLEEVEKPFKADVGNDEAAILVETENAIEDEIEEKEKEIAQLLIEKEEIIAHELKQVEEPALDVSDGEPLVRGDLESVEEDVETQGELDYEALVEGGDVNLDLSKDEVTQGDVYKEDVMDEGLGEIDKGAETAAIVHDEEKLERTEELVGNLGFEPVNELADGIDIDGHDDAKDFWRENSNEDEEKFEAEEENFFVSEIEPEENLDAENLDAGALPGIQKANVLEEPPKTIADEERVFEEAEKMVGDIS